MDNALKSSVNRMEQEYTDFFKKATIEMESEYAQRLLLQIETQGTDTETFWNAAASLFRTCFSEGFSIPQWGRTAFVFLILSFLFSICESVIRNKGIYAALKYVLQIIFAVSVTLSVHDILSSLMLYMRDITAFFGVLTPTIGILTASGGNIASATTNGILLSIFLTAAQFILQSIIPAVFSLFCGLAILEAVSGNEKIQSLSGIIKNALFGIFSILTAIFFIIISYQNFASVNTDTISGKTLRLLVSNAVPIIGGTIGEALKMVGGTLVSVKNSVGISAVLFLLFMYLPVLLILFGNGLLMNLFIFLCDYFSFPEMKGIILHLKYALDFILAAFSAVIIVGMINIGIFMQSLPTLLTL